MLASLYNGNVHIWNYESQTLVKSFEVTDLPGEWRRLVILIGTMLLSLVRASKFVVRKSWVVSGSDDMQIRVFNYNTLEKVHTFEAHTDYIRSIIVHPTHPYILTSSGKAISIVCCSRHRNHSHNTLNNAYPCY